MRDGLTAWEARCMVRVAAAEDPDVKVCAIDDLVSGVRAEERGRVLAELRERSKAGEHLDDLLAEEPG